MCDIISNPFPPNSSTLCRLVAISNGATSEVDMTTRSFVDLAHTIIPSHQTHPMLSLPNHVRTVTFLDLYSGTFFQTSSVLPLKAIIGH